MVLTLIRSDLSDDQLRDLLPITGPQLCERALFRLNIEMRVPFVNLLVTVAANLTAHIRTGRHHVRNQFESTYALLVRSEEKGRGVLETLVYAIFILCVVLSIWQFAQSPIKIPAAGIERCVACEPTVPRAASQS